MTALPLPTPPRHGQQRARLGAAHISAAVALAVALACCCGVVVACAGLDQASLRQAGSSSGNGAPVRIEYYMEALCPYCANFSESVLAPLFANKLINHVELSVVPFGNAHVDVEAGGQIKCQHGQVECDLNRLLSCGVAQAPHQDDFFPFVRCVEREGMAGRGGDVAAVARRCGVHAGLVPDRLMACFEGELGAALQRLAAQRTASLQPPHRYVPWVVVNGVPLLDDDENLQRYICVALGWLRAADRPKACLEGDGDDQEDEDAEGGSVGGGSGSKAAAGALAKDAAQQQPPQQQQAEGGSKDTAAPVRFERCRRGQAAPGAWGDRLAAGAEVMAAA